MQISQLQKSDNYNHLQLKNLHEEFTLIIQGVHNTYIESIIGYSLVHKFIVQHQDSIKELFGLSEVTESDFQDTCHMQYSRIVDGAPQSAGIWSMEKQGDIKNRNAKGGSNELLAGEQAVITLFTYWEDHFRLQLAMALSFLPQSSTYNNKTMKIIADNVSEDMWGDMYLIRTSLIHHRGIATNQCENKSKIYKWFKEGEKIEINFEKMRNILMDMSRFRNHLFVLSKPPQYIRIGS